MWTIIILIVVGYLVLRSILRAMSGPRYYGGGPGVPPGAGGPGPGGPGYGGYGYGPGYYGGGGGFWSGLLGGLGGAWLGNEMFGNRGTTMIDQTGGTSSPPIKAVRLAAAMPADGRTMRVKPIWAARAPVTGAAVDSAAVAAILAAADSAAAAATAEVDGKCAR